jgi:hypothetical protein
VAKLCDVEVGSRRPMGRSLVVVVLVGVAVGLAVTGLVYSIIAVPIYLLAQTDPSGLNRPLVRDGLFRVAIPIGLLVGALAGAVAGVWYGRGGRLPESRSPYEY